VVGQFTYAHGSLCANPLGSNDETLMPTPLIDQLIQRAKEYEARGYEHSHAFGLAHFEAKIESWPTAWGEDLVALLYGDFNPPAAPLVFERLGITVDPEKLEGTIVVTARTVLRARVTVKGKTVAEVKDAVRRLNLLVGTLSYTNQGAPIRWWCYLTAGSGGGIHYVLGENDPGGLLALVDLLPPATRTHLTAALYWLREPRGMQSEYSRSDHLAVYAGYWNAFECLVAAADTLAAHDRRTRTEKNNAITDRLEAAGGRLDVSQLQALYREVVDPGFRAKAEHAIRLCTGEHASRLISQCFAHVPAEHSLYNLRNSINHGAVDVDDPETAMLIDSRFPDLFTLVFLMCGGLLRLNLATLVATAIKAHDGN
jgi:hypothetical protein